jgi:hypothetical protein
LSSIGGTNDKIANFRLNSSSNNLTNYLRWYLTGGTSKSFGLFNKLAILLLSSKNSEPFAVGL